MMYTINRFRPRAARHWSILGLAVISSISVLAFSEVNAAEPDDYRWSAAPSEAQLNALTIRDAILRAFSRNPQIAQAAAQIEVGQANLSAAESAWFPQVSLQGGAGRSHQTDSAGSLNNNGSVGMNLQQLLYDFGKTSGSIDEQNNLTAAYTYQMYSTMNAVGQQTLQNYLQVKRYQELAQASMRNLLSLQKVRDMAQMRADVGLSSQSDVLQASSRIAAMNATYEQYQSQVRSSQAALAALTGAISDNLPDVPQSLLKQEMKQTLSYQQNNAVRSAQAKQQAAAQRVEQAKAQRWPTVSVQAGRTRYSSPATTGTTRFSWWSMRRFIREAR